MAAADAVEAAAAGVAEAVLLVKMAAAVAVAAGGVDLARKVKAAGKALAQPRETEPQIQAALGVRGMAAGAAVAVLRHKIILNFCENHVNKPPAAL